MAKEIILKGLPISDGVAIGTPYFLPKSEGLVPLFYISTEDLEAEVIRYRSAVSESKKDLKNLQKSLRLENSSAIVDILDAHLEILQDPFLTKEMEVKIYQEKRNVESIFQDSITEFKEKFINLNDVFFQDRVRDIMDVSRRILYHLAPPDQILIHKIPKNSVVLSIELVPSDVAEVLEGQAIAFVTQAGGTTSHSAIIARAKKIPFVANINIKELQKEKIEAILVDGTHGRVIVNPSKATMQHYQIEKVGNAKSSEPAESFVDLESKTKDGFPINLFANIESIADVNLLLKNKAAGVGLFRSEYLVLKNRAFPSEEEQFSTYKTLAEQLKGLPLVIRIFDIGGEKHQKIYHEEALQELMHELNPVLGCRAIRFLIRNPRYLHTQLRAILRASVYGNIHILVPMVSDLEELIFVKKSLEEIKRELNLLKVPFAEKIPLGCMIEVPSSAIMSDVIAEHADFLSIGTNDLIQYVVAADRSNPNISNLYSPAHPSVLRLIEMIVQSAKKREKPLILCGEIAADPKFIPLLLGLGIHDFSLSVRHIPKIKMAIHSISIQEALEAANGALQCISTKELTQYLYPKVPL